MAPFHGWNSRLNKIGEGSEFQNARVPVSSFLTIDLPWLALSSLFCLGFYTMIHNMELWAKTNPFSTKLFFFFFVGVLHNRKQKQNCCHHLRGGFLHLCGEWRCSWRLKTWSFLYSTSPDSGPIVLQRSWLPCSLRLFLLLCLEMVLSELSLPPPNRYSTWKGHFSIIYVFRRFLSSNTHH